MKPTKCPALLAWYPDSSQEQRFEGFDSGALKGHGFQPCRSRPSKKRTLAP